MQGIIDMLLVIAQIYRFICKLSVFKLNDYIYYKTPKALPVYMTSSLSMLIGVNSLVSSIPLLRSHDQPRFI